jgi:hypothetical protein
MPDVGGDEAMPALWTLPQWSLRFRFFHIVPAMKISNGMLV